MFAQHGKTGIGGNNPIEKLLGRNRQRAHILCLYPAGILYAFIGCHSEVIESSAHIPSCIAIIVFSVQFYQVPLMCNGIVDAVDFNAVNIRLRAKEGHCLRKRIAYAHSVTHNGISGRSIDVFVLGKVLRVFICFIVVLRICGQP